MAKKRTAPKGARAVTPAATSKRTPSKRAPAKVATKPRPKPPPAPPASTPVSSLFVPITDSFDPPVRVEGQADHEYLKAIRQFLVKAEQQSVNDYLAMGIGKSWPEPRLSPVLVKVRELLHPFGFRGYRKRGFRSVTQLPDQVLNEMQVSEALGAAFQWVEDWLCEQKRAAVSPRPHFEPFDGTTEFVSLPVFMVRPSESVLNVATRLINYLVDVCEVTLRDNTKFHRAAGAFPNGNVPTGTKERLQGIFDAARHCGIDLDNKEPPITRTREKFKSVGNRPLRKDWIDSFVDAQSVHDTWKHVNYAKCRVESVRWEIEREAHRDQLRGPEEVKREIERIWSMWLRPNDFADWISIQDWIDDVVAALGSLGKCVDLPGRFQGSDCGQMHSLFCSIIAVLRAAAKELDTPKQKSNGPDASTSCFWCDGQSYPLGQGNEFDTVDFLWHKPERRSHVNDLEAHIFGNEDASLTWLRGVIFRVNKSLRKTPYSLNRPRKSAFISLVGD